MTTPVFLTNWGHQATLNNNGKGLCDVVNGTGMSIDTTVYKDAVSPQSLKAVASASATYLQYAQVLGNGVMVGRFYVYFAGSLPSANHFFFTGPATDTTSAQIMFRSATGKFNAYQSGQTEVVGPSASANTWYRIDFRFTWNSTTHTIDWQVDGANQPQFSVGSQTNCTFNFARIGAVGATTATTNFCHLILSVTSADYPIGPGGTELLKPTSDGTHSNAANVLEDNTGADIDGSTVFAYNKINSVPTSAANYIQCNNAGSANYVEVLFSDITATHSSILGALGLLAYTSATTTANNGACIISKDAFSTFTEIWGNPTTRQDYSDGSTSNLFWKAAILNNVTDDTTVNALKARLGYSSDATPDPYWIDLYVEVAYYQADSTPLTIQNADSTHTADAFALTQHNILVIAAADSLHGADTFALTQHNILVIQAADSLSSADAPQLGVGLLIAAADSLSNSDNLNLTQHGILTIQAADSSHTADNLTLTAYGGTVVLVIQDADSLHTEDVLNLLQHNILIIQGSDSASSSDAPVLTSNPFFVLVVQDADSLQTSTVLELIQHHVLTVQDADSPSFSEHAQFFTGKLGSMIVLDGVRVVFRMKGTRSR